MTFLYGTNMELLYSMPVVGATQSASARTLISGNSSTNPPFQLPALTNIWSPGSLQGKGLMVVASGGYDVGGNSVSTTLAFDVAAGTGAATSVTPATMGLCTLPTSTSGAWEAQVWLNCVGTGTVSTWYANGTFTVGPGSAETGSAAATALTFMWGQPAIVAGVPTGISIPVAQAYYVDLYSSFTANPTAMVCTQFMVFGLN